MRTRARHACIYLLLLSIAFSGSGFNCRAFVMSLRLIHFTIISEILIRLSADYGTTSTGKHTMAQLREAADYGTTPTGSRLWHNSERQHIMAQSERQQTVAQLRQAADHGTTPRSSRLWHTPISECQDPVTEISCSW